MKQQIMTHLVCGYPSLDESKNIFKTLWKYSEYIEVQFPFSDPIADGELISKANDIALKSWITTQKCFDFIKENKKHIDSKIIIMTYFNIVYNYWIEKFIIKAKSSWAYGFIIPDLPFDEKEFQEFIELCEENKLYFIPVLSPGMDESRIEKLSKIKTQIIYSISKRMTTGSKFSLWKDFSEYIKILKKYFSCKIAVWFGISSQNDIQEVLKVADIAVIGSEIIRRYEKDWINGIDEFFN